MSNFPTITTSDIKLVKVGQYIHIGEQNGKEMMDKIFEWKKMFMIRNCLFDQTLQQSYINAFTEYINDQFTFVNEFGTI